MSGSRNVRLHVVFLDYWLCSICLAISEGRALPWRGTNRTERTYLAMVNQIYSAGHLNNLDQSIYRRFMLVIIFFFHSIHKYKLIQNIWKAINRRQIYILNQKCFSLHLRYLLLTAKVARFGELSVVILFVMERFGELSIAKRTTYFSPSSPIARLAKQIEHGHCGLQPRNGCPVYPILAL